MVSICARSFSWKLVLSSPDIPASLVGALAFLFLLFPVTDASAASVCPKGYMQVETQNPLVGVQSSIIYTVCVYSRSYRNHLDAKFKISLAATNSKALGQAILDQVGSQGNCNYFGQFNQNGWKIVSLGLNFQRVSGAAHVQVSGTTQDCYKLGGSFLYDVPLRSAYSGGALTLLIDASQARLIKYTGLSSVFYGEFVGLLSSRVSQALGGLNYQFNRYVPRILSEVDPRIDSVDVTINQGAVRLVLTASAQLTAENAEQFLSAQTKGLDINQLFQFMKRGLPGPGV
jgi:hypothetical protein